MEDRRRVAALSDRKCTDRPVVHALKRYGNSTDKNPCIRASGHAPDRPSPDE